MLASGQLNWSSKCSAQRQSRPFCEWMLEPSRSVMVSLTPALLIPVFLISWKSKRVLPESLAVFISLALAVHYCSRSLRRLHVSLRLTHLRSASCWWSTGIRLLECISEVKRSEIHVRYAICCSVSQAEERLISWYYDMILTNRLPTIYSNRADVLYKLSTSIFNAATLSSNPNPYCWSQEKTEFEQTNSFPNGQRHRLPGRHLYLYNLTSLEKKYN